MRKCGFLTYANSKDSDQPAAVQPDKGLWYIYIYRLFNDSVSGHRSA